MREYGIALGNSANACSRIDLYGALLLFKEASYTLNPKP
jgi:hypothetical protein